jgi:predicted acylesterase/phospholipase RssA
VTSSTHDHHASRRDGSTPADPARPRAARIGLVLAGGGAKGAYQVGCLRALRDAGLGTPAAIAGTSVGAIHAVMLATDKLDEAEQIWTRLRWRDVSRIAYERLHRLPLWGLAALNSEFSPFKVWRLSDSVTHPVRWRRWVYPAACAATAGVLAALGRWLPALRLPAVTLAAAFGVSGGLAALHARLRPHFLGSSFISHSPLAARLSDAISPADWQRVRDAGTPIVATLSQFRPHTHGAIPWGGWVPQYVRLDRMSRERMIEMLIAGSALPGFSDVSSVDGTTRLDGAWTDNVPAAPLLFDPALDLDLVFVVYLKNVVRHRFRHNSLHGVASLLLTEAMSGQRRHEDELVEWARLRWSAAGRDPAPGETRALPRVVRIVPSRHVGNFFSGTIWFSPARSRQLIELGRQDAERALEVLGLRPQGGTVSRQPVPDTPLGTPVAEAARALSSPDPCHAPDPAAPPAPAAM